MTISCDSICQLPRARVCGTIKQRHGLLHNWWLTVTCIPIYSITIQPHPCYPPNNAILMNLTLLASQSYMSHPPWRTNDICCCHCGEWRPSIHHSMWRFAWAKTNGRVKMWPLKLLQKIPSIAAMSWEHYPPTLGIRSQEWPCPQNEDRRQWEWSNVWASCCSIGIQNLEASFLVGWNWVMIVYYISCDLNYIVKQLVFTVVAIFFLWHSNRVQYNMWPALLINFGN